MMPTEPRQGMPLRPAKMQVQESTSHADASLKSLTWLSPTVMAINIKLCIIEIALSHRCNALWLLYAKLSRLESAGTVLGLNFVWKFSCLTNHALYVCHSVPGVSSSTSKFLRNVGTSL